MEDIFRFFTMWTLVIFISTVLACAIFPKLLPLWFFIGVACLMTSIGVIGSLLFNTLTIYNKVNESPSQVAGDYAAHILPVLFLFIFYPILAKRFYHTENNIIKSALFPFIISIIYICTHDIEKIYSMSSLSTPIIVLLTICVWLSSYPIFAKSFKEY